MAMLTEYSDIRISRLSVPPIIPAVQGDTGRQLVFTPTDYTIPADCTATYYIQKPSGNAVYNNATIEDGKVVCDLTAQALAENGDNYGQIRIMKDEEVVTSFDFVLLVKPFRGIDAIESTTEMNIFDKAVEQAEAAIEAAAQEAEEYISQAIDATLTIEGKAADAKATGDAITNVASDLSDLSDTVSGQGDRLDTAENDIDGLQGDMTTAQEDIGALQDDVSDLEETKASTDGTYENLTAGTAEQLLSDTGIEDSTPYTLRRSKAGNREYDEVVGGSIVYNQLVNSDTSSVTVPSDHKYYAVIGGTASIGTGGSALSVTGGTDMVVDLSVMFGSTVANHIYGLEQSTVGAGVALFKEMFPNEYYSYNAGELMSVSGVSAHVMTGFNQWDEQWQVGGLAWATGAEITSTSSRRTDFIPVWEGESYYLKAPYGSGCVWYDAGKERVGSMTSILNNGIVVAPTNASYIRIVFGSVGVNTEYGHDICFNVSDPKRNGTYEPYTEYRYPLDSSLTLRGVPKVVDGNICYDGDVYASDGTVTRKYGTLDLGTKNWTRTTSYSEPFFYASTNDAAENAEAICSKYEYISNNGMTASRFPTVASDKMFSFSNNGTQIYIRDDSYTDAATFKTAMSGVYFVYELATSTTETALPYQHLQVVDAGGTEEYVTTGLVPVGHNTKYPTDIVKKIDGLPSDFSTLIAPTEAQMVATRNYNTGALFIVNNVLYKATANIANGGAITPGTNCLATTLAEVISALS